MQKSIISCDHCIVVIALKDKQYLPKMTKTVIEFEQKLKVLALEKFQTT